MHAKLFSLWFYSISCLSASKVKRVERKFSAKRIEFRFVFAMMTVDGLSNGPTFISPDCILERAELLFVSCFAFPFHQLFPLYRPRTNETERPKRQKNRIYFGKRKIKERNKLSFRSVLKCARLLFQDFMSPWLDPFPHIPPLLNLITSSVTSVWAGYIQIASRGT